MPSLKGMQLSEKPVEHCVVPLSVSVAWNGMSHIHQHAYRYLNVSYVRANAVPCPENTLDTLSFEIPNLTTNNPRTPVLAWRWRREGWNKVVESTIGFIEK